MIKILIVDDHPIVRMGTKHIFKKAPDITVADEATNGAEAIDKILTNSFDVIVLDISMPGRGGLDILKQIKMEKPDLPVLILSMHPEKQYAIRALKTGASGYLTKESAPNELITAIRIVSKGERYISSSLATILASYLDSGREKQTHEALSDREYQVMCLIASGKTLTQISEELSLSISTISTYRTRILAKMNMKNNAELTRYAIEKHLVD